MMMRDMPNDRELVEKIAKNVMDLANLIEDNRIVINIDDNGKTVARIYIRVDYIDGDENANENR